jgi:hypothetical protein
VILETAPVDGSVRPDRFEPFDPTPHDGEPTYGELRKLLDNADGIVAVHGNSEPFNIVNVSMSGTWMKFIPAGFITEESVED